MRGSMYTLTVYYYFVVVRAICIYICFTLVPGARAAHGRGNRKIVKGEICRHSRALCMPFPGVFVDGYAIARIIVNAPRRDEYWRTARKVLSRVRKGREE